MSEATDQVAYSLRDTQQTMADHLIALQQANLKFTQKNFSNWIELVTEQFKSMQHWQQQWEQQVRTQQEVFLSLLSGSMELSMHLFLTPFSLARYGSKAMEDLLRPEREQGR
jgi:predicted PurR-regulated permease PerM